MPFNVHRREDEWRDEDFIEDDFSTDQFSDEDIDESLLTDDLLEIAAQLGDDAAHLQACYPAHRPSVVDTILSETGSENRADARHEKAAASTAKPRKKRWAALAFGFGAVCLLVAVGSISVRSYHHEVASNSNGSVASSEDTRAITEFRTTDLEASGGNNEATVFEASSTMASPTITEIGNATGPQLEALYDYLEDEDQEVRLSI